MATADNVKSKIQGLINKSNETTGNADTDLTSAVNRLVEGYGQGGGEQPTLFAPIVTEGVNLISWENDTRNGGFAVSIIATIDGETVTSPLTVTEDMNGKTLLITAKAENFIDGIENISVVYASLDLSYVYLPDAAEIAAYTYANNKDIKTVTAPNVKTIGNNAFYFSSIENISMDKLETIGDYSFYSCTNLYLTELPSGLISIGISAFQDCTKLAITELPAGLTHLKHSAFRGCKNLALTSLPECWTNINDYAFQGCSNLILASLPSGITSIGEHAFNGCSKLALTSLPDGITSIKLAAFKDCSNLALTSLPEGVTSIAGYAFDTCYKFTTITFKGTPNSIASTAFAHCTKLKTINVPWAEGAVANAPWGATNATINYNYTGE